MKSNFVMTKNVKNFVTLTNNLLNRGNGVPGMALIYGEPGLGKSKTAVWWTANNNAVHVQATQNMTPKWLLEEIVKELGEYPASRSADLFNQVIKSLIAEPKILIIDEIDYLAKNKDFIEILRDIYDRTNTPIIMIGMGLANKKLERYKHLYDRLFAILKFESFKPEEITQMINEISEIKFTPESIDYVYKMEFGFRQIVNLIDKSEIIAQANGLSEIDLNMVTKIFKKGV